MLPFVAKHLSDQKFASWQSSIVLASVGQKWGDRRTREVFGIPSVNGVKLHTFKWSHQHPCGVREHFI